MDAHEVAQQAHRIARYRKLETEHAEIRSAIASLTDTDENGPCGQGPFTRNTRESRRVQSLHFKFTATRGGSHPVERRIHKLNVEAWELGQAIEGMLRKRLESVLAAMREV